MASMSTSTNPFRRTREETSESQTQVDGLGIVAPTATTSTTTRTKVPPPAPIPRAARRNTGTENTSDLSREDLAELDELERQSASSKPAPPQPRSTHSRTTSFSGSSSPKSVPPPPVQRARKTSNLAIPTNIKIFPYAPDPNQASTPMPFGEALPTPDIVPRDLTKPITEGGGRRTSVGGGVTSSGLVDASIGVSDVEAELSALNEKVDHILRTHH